MILANAVTPPTSDWDLFVVIDLIGDLDITLADILAGTLEHQAALGGGNLVVNCKFLAGASPDGIAALARAVDELRGRGCPVFLIPGSHRLRLAFKAAQLASPLIDILPAQSRRRHVMIARHGSGSSSEPVKQRRRRAGTALPQRRS